MVSLHHLCSLQITLYPILRHSSLLHILLYSLVPPFPEAITQMPRSESTDRSPSARRESEGNLVLCDE